MGEDCLPPRLRPPELDQDLGSYWIQRLEQHTSDWYAGVRISKLPEDLRTYEHLLWASNASVVIELGTQLGGSALWFRDRLAALQRYGRIGKPLVITVDVDIAGACDQLAGADPSYSASIIPIEGDVRDKQLPARVASLIPADSRCFVVEDTAHTYETTLAALNGFAQFVAPGGYFVVEDGCVDIEQLRLNDHWPRGVIPALEDWIRSPAANHFRVRRDLELYGVTCHPRGFLQRVTVEDTP